MERQHDNLAIALDAREKGLVAIPFYPGTKTPMVKWKEWQDKMPPEELLREWFEGTRTNIAIITTGMVTFDAETEGAAQIVLEKCGASPQMLRTPGGGIHIDFRLRAGTVLTNQVRILKTKKKPEGELIDIRTNGGLKMIPASETEKGRYEWLGEGLMPISELPVANIGWTRTRVKKRVIEVVQEQCEGSFLIHRGQKYIDTFERRAISGQGGHTALFVAALKIVSFVRKLGGSESDAWQLLLYFNATHASPPWDVTKPDEERALRHKLDEALKKAK